jgi:hypothetical protein
MLHTTPQPARQKWPRWERTELGRGLIKHHKGYMAVILLPNDANPHIWAYIGNGSKVTWHPTPISTIETAKVWADQQLITATR